MAIEKVDHNKVTIKYAPDARGRLGYDSINIDIQHTSFGALKLLTSDLGELAKKWRQNDNECWHPVSSYYADLLEKLCKDLKTQILD